MSKKFNECKIYSGIPRCRFCIEEDLKIKDTLWLVKHDDSWGPEAYPWLRKLEPKEVFFLRGWHSNDNGPHAKVASIEDGSSHSVRPCYLYQTKKEAVQAVIEGMEEVMAQCESSCGKLRNKIGEANGR